MTAAPDKITQSVLGVLPAPLSRRLRTEAGRRFIRFIVAAVMAVIASQLALGLLTGPVNMTAGTAGVIASMLGALVSYLLSRWAWESRGRPDLLRETLPFWVVSLAVWGILGLTSHFASTWAHSMGYTHLRKHLVVQGAYFLMNCITFLARFVLFHYVLFARRPRPAEALDIGMSAPGLAEAGVPAAGVPGLPAELASELAEERPGGSDTGPLPALSGNAGPSGR